LTLQVGLYLFLREKKFQIFIQCVKHYLTFTFKVQFLSTCVPFLWPTITVILWNYFHYPFQNYMHALYNSCLENHVTNPNSNEYKLTAIVLDIGSHRLFKPVGIKKDEIDKCFFLKLLFANKGLDGINLGNILHHKLVKSKIPPYFKDQSIPIILYAYTIPIATKICNYKHLLYDLNMTISNLSLLIAPYLCKFSIHI
jgi:hypothetical protein